MKKLQTDGESFMIKDAFAVARGEAKVVHSEAMARVREGRKNLEQFVRYKKNDWGNNCVEHMHLCALVSLNVRFAGLW